MRPRSLIIVLAACSLAHAQGVLNSRGADRLISRSSGETQQEIAIVDGEIYLVKSCARTTGSGGVQLYLKPRYVGQLMPKTEMPPLVSPRYLSCSPEPEDVGWD
jgi:hypothetical protein